MIRRQRQPLSFWQSLGVAPIFRKSFLLQKVTMPWLLIVVVIAVLTAVIAAWSGRSDLGGLEIGAFVGLATGLVMAIWIGGSVLRNYRGRIGEGAKALAGWMAILLVLVTGYAYRFELAAIANRVAGVVVPGLVLVGGGGEVTVSRGASGHFSLPIVANGRELRMMFDTGASTIVLRAEDARALGLSLGPADYTVPIATANGRATAAPIMLERVSIGGILEERVQALVAQPGQLRENLLGMSFLERLSSYEVRGDQLILRGRGS
jgi:aspartyl protease family protein